MKRSHVIVLGWMLCAGSAFAQPPHKWYAGVDLGQAKLDRSSQSEQISAADETAMAYSLLAGYRFSRFFALEAGYSDLGEFSASPDPELGNVTSRSHGISLDMKIMWPIAKHFELELDIGNIWLKNDVSGSGGFLDTLEYSGSVPKFGIGFSVPVNERLAFDFAAVQYVNFFDMLEFDSDLHLFTEDTSTYMLGVRWNF